MATTSTKRLMTAEEFLRADLGEGVYELVRGEVVAVTPPPNREHGFICANLAYWLTDYGRRTGFGYCLANDTAVRTTRSPDSVRGADLCFFSEARAPRAEIGPDFAPVAPDLVVEVVSPSNRPGELMEKVAEYLDAGVGLVWLVDPKHRSIALYRTSAAAPVLLREGDGIRDLPELPGFRCPVSDVFA